MKTTVGTQRSNPKRPNLKMAGARGGKTRAQKGTEHPSPLGDADEHRRRVTARLSGLKPETVPASQAAGGVEKLHHTHGWRL